MDTKLRELFAVIVRRDLKALSRQLKASPELALAALRTGASRAASKEFFLNEIMHYVYGGDTALHVAAQRIGLTASSSCSKRVLILRRAIATGSGLCTMPARAGRDYQSGSPKIRPRLFKFCSMRAQT